MSNKEQHWQYRNALTLVMVLLACAWLIPATAVMAASASSGFTVTIEVVDTVAIDSGSEWHQLTPLPEGDNLQTEFVTRGASPQLNADGASSGIDAGLPLGNDSSKTVEGGATTSDLHLMITATRL